MFLARVWFHDQLVDDFPSLEGPTIYNLFLQAKYTGRQTLQDESDAGGSVYAASASFQILLMLPIV